MPVMGSDKSENFQKSEKFSSWSAEDELGSFTASGVKLLFKCYS